MLTILVSILTIVGCSYIIPKNNLLREDPAGIGKSIYLTINNGGTNDDTVIERLELWDEAERNKLVRYMKENNLRIAPGKYVINRRTPFEVALKKFIFEIIQ